MIAEKNELKGLLRTYAVQHGDFTLVSGRKSTYLIDCKRVMLTAEGHYLIGRVLYQLLVRDLFYRQDIGVAGVAVGGCALASTVSVTSMFWAETRKPSDWTVWCPRLDALYVRKEAKDHGSKSLVDGVLRQGQKVVLLEDVITTGGSSIRAVNTLKSVGYEVAGVVSLVDRNEGGKEALVKEFPGVMVYSVFKADELL